MISFTWIEKLLLLAGIIASGYVFWQRFGKVAGIIRASKKDVNFTLGDVARRARVFVWEVLFQGKVIQQRPLPGIAHAFVFWGFCAFGLVTANHFALGAGFQLISPDGFFGRAYFAFAAMFAVLVRVSILVLAF